jgi:hypothetical protein
MFRGIGGLSEMIGFIYSEMRVISMIWRDGVVSDCLKCAYVVLLV